MDFLPYLLSGVAALGIGAIYYHPKVFGTMWMHASGLNEEKLQGGNMAIIFGLAFLFAMMIAMSMSYTMDTHLATDPHFEPKAGPFGHGATHGIITCMFLIVPVIGTITLFERRSFKYAISHILYWLITFAVISGIVTAL
jgi:uncharacterized membrane protein YhaH (DUF805 family)